ncbi:MAG: hypothetical protein KBA66_14955 [Leptospiraceae bacterium]|nr:hypothetical protein [Leptospiraceae bacterium]
MKVYQKSLQILMLSIMILTVTACSNQPFTKKEYEEPKDNWPADAFWLVWLATNIYYNNCPPVNAVLDSGTHAINLADGQEYWFDITAKKIYANDGKSYQTSFDIYFQYEPFSTMYFFNGNCMKNFIDTRSNFSPNKNYPNAISSGGFYKYTARMESNSNISYYLIGIKLKGSNGLITIQAP